MPARFTKATSYYFLLASVQLIVGCATYYSVSVSAFSTPSAKSARRYLLIPGNKDTDPKDLEFREYAEYVHRALALEGFTRVDNLASADVVIVLLYSISDPRQQTRTYLIPHWGTTGYASARTYGAAYNYGNFTTYSATTHLVPQYGITGYSTGVKTVVTFTRRLGLFAYKAESLLGTQGPDEIWRVTVVSVGSSGDLRKVFPYLVAAARDYLGKATPRQAVEYRFREGDKRVVAIQRISESSRHSKG